MEQITKKKKKRILTKILNPDESNIHTSIDIIVKRLFNIFAYHIGKENSISSSELFKEIYHVYPDELNIFERTYLWNVLKVLFTKLRSNEELFIVNNGSEYYVLKNQEEANVFKAKITRTIKALEDVKIKADNWIKNKKWKNNKDYL